MRSSSRKGKLWLTGETMRKRIILVHAYLPSMAPIVDAFARLWPQAEVLNLLDESIYADVGADGVLPKDVWSRVDGLLRQASQSRADGIVFTGATFGPAVEAARQAIALTILKADEAMCEELAQSEGRVAVLCTAPRALPVIRAGIQSAASALGRAPPEIVEFAIPAAKDALVRGDDLLHDHLIAEAIMGASDCSSIALGQISMTGARMLAPLALAERIVVSPECSVRKMRRLLATDEGGRP